MAFTEAVVVFDKKTKEVIACVPTTDGETAICRKDVDFQIYKGTEPIFTETGKGIVLNTNAFIWNGG